MPPVSKQIRQTKKNGASISAPLPSLRITEGGAFFFLSGETVTEALAPTTRQEFLNRLFMVDTVKSVLVNPQDNNVRLRFASGENTNPEKIQDLARAMRRMQSVYFRFIDLERLPAEFFHRPYEVWRIGEEISLWKIDRIRRKDYRLWHPLLSDSLIREKVLDRLSISDVIPLPRVFKADESIKIHCHSAELNDELLKEILDSALEELPEAKEEEEKSLIPRETLLHTNLALAPLSDFFLPPLGIANLVIVWLINREHWPHALESMRRGRTNLHLLYLTIGCLTALSFEFSAAAAMYWLMHYWPKWTKQLRRKSQRRLLSHYQRLPTSAKIEEEGEIVEVTLHGLARGSEIILQAGDIIPGDGNVLKGTATVDESWIRGLSEPTIKSKGDPLFASTRLLEGKLRMRLECHGTRTEAARVASWHRDHMAQPRVPRESEAERLAESLTLPTLLLGALAFFRGGIHMSKAVLRPDYLTGPRMTEELVDLQAMKKLAPSGIVVIQPDALDRVAAADCVIFDDSVEWNTRSPDEPSITEFLKELGINEIILLSEHSGKEASRLAKDWGFDHFEAEMHSGKKVAFITQRRHLGRKVVYFGDCQREAQVAAHADVAISVAQPPYPETVLTPVVLLQPDLGKCAQFMSVTLNRTQVLETALTTTLVPNIIAIAGGLYLHFSVGTTVILTNLGTLITYLRLRKEIL